MTSISNANSSQLRIKGLSFLCLGGLICLFGGLPLLAGETQEDPPVASDSTDGKADRDQSTVLEQVRVISKPAGRTPGSFTYIDSEQLDRQGYNDIHRILRGVPGLNIQEEDGYGLRPNIGIRGSGSERSQKITLLEDGVLIAPAPYSAPSAYYFPTAGRMDGIEIRKGSSSIRQGPQTNGGVLNLLSVAIPNEFGGRLQVSSGSDATSRLSARIGDSGSRYGWVFETYQFESEGFKKLDSGGETGFDLQDYLFKTRYILQPGARYFQMLELKIGKTRQFGNETYLGLSDDDFRITPYRRYAASQEDTITTDHEQIQLRYLLRLREGFDVVTTVYRNDFFRNWSKLQSVHGQSIASILESPGEFAEEFSILRGDTDSNADALKLRNNRRNYFSQGIQTTVRFRSRERFSNHGWEFSLRVHEDEEDRFQEEDSFRMLAGQMELTALGDPGSQSNRISGANAIAGYVEDEITLGRWTLTPGLRFESIDFSRDDFGKNDPLRQATDLNSRRTNFDVLIPGFGVNFETGPRGHLFAGVHRGFAPPGPGSSQQADPEDSINYELGYRFEGPRSGAQVVGFFIDYDNLLGSDTLSSGGTGSLDMFNGGEVNLFGFEASYRTELFHETASSFRFPIAVAYTFMSAEFRSNFDSDFAGWGDLVVTGDSLPYLPAHQVSLQLGAVHPVWAVFSDFAWVDQARTVAGQGPIEPSKLIDPYFLMDLSVEYTVREKLRLFLQARNLTDEIYIVARRPAGARPGIGRTLMLGVKWDF